MGMFDTVIIEDENDLPDDLPYVLPPEHRSFQTKSMHNEMRTYLVRDGRLLHRKAIMRQTDRVDEFLTRIMGDKFGTQYHKEVERYDYVDTGYHGDVELHTFFDLDDEQVRVWLQLEMRLTEGQLQWIRMITEDEDNYYRPATREEVWNDNIVELKETRAYTTERETYPPVTRKK